MTFALLRKLLISAGDIEVIGEAATGIDAFHLARELVPDVLLLDMEMPQLTGVEVARRLQAIRSPVRILALSSYDDRSYIKGLLDIGAAGYLIKAEAGELIVEAVRGVAQGETGWVSRQVAKAVSLPTPHNQPEVQIPLTEPEKSVLRLAAAAKTNREIGSRLDLNERMVETFLELAAAKLGTTSWATAVSRARQKGLI